MTTIPRGVADLPIIGTKGAPKKFKGRSSEVEPFLSHYEKLCRKHAVTNDQEKIENITQYCSRLVREFLEGLDSYTGGVWTTFKKDFKEFFNADKDERRFRTKDLDKYVIKSRKKSSMASLAHWRTYNRGFIRIAGWLKSHQKITDDQYDTSFWQGIPQSFRERLEQRIMSQDPDHDLTEPFSHEEVEKNAKALLRCDRFDRDRLPESDSDVDGDDSDNESDDDDSDSSSDSDSESSSSDSSCLLHCNASSLARRRNSVSSSASLASFCRRVLCKRTTER